MPVGPPPCKGEGSGGGESRARRPAAMQGAWRPYVRHRRCAGVAVSAAVVAAAAKRPRSVATGIARSKRTASLICRWVPEGSLAGFVDRRRSPRPAQNRSDLLCASLRVPCRIFGAWCGPVVGSEPPLRFLRRRRADFQKRGFLMFFVNSALPRDSRSPGTLF